MSGHSKWATTKHQKGAKDKARGKLFAKLIRQVEVAAREGGGDLTANATLRTMFQKARDASVPLDTIERAIKRGTGELEGVRYEAVTYEGYAPAAWRSSSSASPTTATGPGAEVRTIFSRNGGSMAEPGRGLVAVRAQGRRHVPAAVPEDDLMAIVLDAGAEDVRDEGESWMVVCAALGARRRARSARGGGDAHRSSAELQMLPTTTVEVDDESDAHEGPAPPRAARGPRRRQNVYSNFDIPDAILERVEA